MNYTYFTLDKNPKQIKKVSIGGYEVTMRIEWNSRSNCWYVLGYVGNDLVLRNTKVIEGNLYNFDQDSDYYLPYLFTIQPKYKNYDWDTEALMFFIDDNLAVSVDGLLKDGGLITRHIATSSNTHSRVALRGADNKYLFDIVSIPQETGITIICTGADASFKTINLPQGRWDFTINGLRRITADTEAFRSLMNDYGIQITNVGNNEYMWTNNSNQEVRIEGLYPYAAGYDFNVVESSNESAKIHSVDSNNWVNRFTVCLVPASSLIWKITNVNVLGKVATYDAVKGLNTSFADLDLTQATVDSISVTQLQTSQVVKDAIGELTNNTSGYSFNNDQKVVSYNDDSKVFMSGKYLFDSSAITPPVYVGTPMEAVMLHLNKNSSGYPDSKWIFARWQQDNESTILKNPNNGYLYWTVGRYLLEHNNYYTESINQRVNYKLNPNYNPDNPLPQAQLPYIQIANLIIQKAISGDNAAQLYLDHIARTALNEDEGSQIVKFSTLVPKFEANKQ